MFVPLVSLKLLPGRSMGLPGILRAEFLPFPSELPLTYRLFLAGHLLTALTRALEFACEAVCLSSSNNNRYAAVVAYRRSMALLSEVIERATRGEDRTQAQGERSRFIVG